MNNYSFDYNNYYNQTRIETFPFSQTESLSVKGFVDEVVTWQSVTNRWKMLPIIAF